MKSDPHRGDVHHDGERSIGVPHQRGAPHLEPSMNVAQTCSTMNMAVGLLFAAALGCGAADSSGEGELGATQQAWIGTECNGSTVTHQCWTGTGSHQVHALDDIAGFRWYVKSTSGPGTYNTVFTWEGIWPVGYLDRDSKGLFSGALPTDIVSVAVNLSSGNGFVYALTDDGFVVQSFGKPAASKLATPNGVDFGHWRVYIGPLDKSGHQVSLKQIVSLRLPTNFGQGILLLGLDYSGRIYVEDALASGERRWMPARQHPGFSGLPSVSWAEISRNVAGGAYLLTTPDAGSDIYKAATGGITSSAGAVSWDPVQRLPRIVDGSRRLLPTHVGGHYIITDAGNGTCTLGVGCDGDDRRFYSYDRASSTWGPMNVGTNDFVPNSTDDLKEAPFNKQIWDTGGGFAVQLPFTHVSTYHL